MKSGLVGAVVVIGTSVAIGAGVTWFLTRHQTVVETAAPAVVQADGSHVIERTATTPDAKPKHQIPKGGTVERVVSVTVQGKQPDFSGIKLAGDHFPQPDKLVCPPVTVDLSLVRMPDQTRRVVASSPDGQVLSGLDVPVETQALPEPKPWAAGLSYDPVKQTPGVWVERDIWRVRLGAEINQARQRVAGPVGTEVRLRVGFTF